MTAARARRGGLYNSTGSNKWYISSVAVFDVAYPSALDKMMMDKETEGPPECSG
jgi:hypothetical protein